MDVNEYTVCLDGVNGYSEEFYTTNDFKELIYWVEEDLRRLGGGHADIYDEDGDFVEDVEV